MDPMRAAIGAGLRVLRFGPAPALAAGTHPRRSGGARGCTAGGCTRRGYATLTGGEAVCGAPAAPHTRSSDGGAIATAAKLPRPWCPAAHTHFTRGREAMVSQWVGPRAFDDPVDPPVVHWVVQRLEQQRGKVPYLVDQQILGYACELALSVRSLMGHPLLHEGLAALHHHRAVEEWLLRRVGIYLWRAYREAPFDTAPGRLRGYLQKLILHNSGARSRSFLTHAAMVCAKTSQYREGIRYARRAEGLPPTAARGHEAASRTPFPNPAEEREEDTRKLDAVCIALCATASEGIETYVRLGGALPAAEVSGETAAPDWRLLFLLTHLRNHNDLAAAVHFVNAASKQGVRVATAHIGRVMEIYARCGMLREALAMYEQSVDLRHRRDLVGTFIRCCRCVGTPEAAHLAVRVLQDHIRITKAASMRPFLHDLLNLLALAAAAGDRAVHGYAVEHLNRLPVPATVYMDRLTSVYPPPHPTANEQADAAPALAAAGELDRAITRHAAHDRKRFHGRQESP